jgi:pyridoxine kinase
VVVLTSLVFPNSEDVIVIMASSMVGDDIQSYCIEVPRIQSYFTGTGDLFCALLLGWVDRYPMDLKTALEHAVSGLQIVLQDTASHAQSVMKEESIRIDDRKSSWWRCRELRLIQNQDALVSPEILYHARECDHIQLN